jgi:hypothetical protein
VCVARDSDLDNLDIGTRAASLGRRG